MKLWQYGTIIVLIIGAYFIGDMGGYNDGYDLGYLDGGFDEGWHAAIQLNAPYTALGNQTFDYVDGRWSVTYPHFNGMYATAFYDGERWILEE